ncbi:AAA family ATPase [Eubacteriales bacterium OttesenSCG-928-M02]|nr:AAA family ATPase [Eubacteriales bacterium OttesenSCG-928-M02]
MKKLEQQWKLEREYLEDMKAIALREIKKLEEEGERYREEIQEAKKEMRTETAHAISDNLYGTEAFEQLNELSQVATQISITIAGYENAMRQLEKLKKLLSAPYFARIDFTFAGTDTPKEIYIGRSTLRKAQEICIFDWRAPVASMFYRYGPGPASYQAPQGTIEGTMELKRQYEIKDGLLEYFFDADIEILDEYLRKMLSQNASPQMKSIVETIQREQDMVIRDEKSDVLVVQGVAGSGKTSVALHRAAYLMYAGLTDTLASQNILILSPNTVFEKYIANVLPELGEENVNTYLLEELFRAILGVREIQTRLSVMEQMVMGEGDWVCTLYHSMVFKCTEAFLAILDILPIPERQPNAIRGAYTRLFAQKGYLQALGKEAGVELPQDIDEIVAYTLENLETSRLFFDDASALAYLFVKHLEVEDYRHIRQVVVDEAQDYYPIHYHILKGLFPNAKYTILGDIHQTIHKPEEMDFYMDILKVLDKKKNATVTLEKSFRCTNQIIKYAAKILHTNIQAFGREGDAPIITQVADGEDRTPLVKEVENCLALGYGSIGILCKTQRECNRLYEKLSKEMAVTLFDQTAAGSLKGVVILPIYLCKGLEFDAVLLWGVDALHYASQADKNLLFIGCTRALHRLSLFYWGDISPLCPAIDG